MDEYAQAMPKMGYANQGNAKTVLSQGLLNGTSENLMSHNSRLIETARKLENLADRIFGPVPEELCADKFQSVDNGAYDRLARASRDIEAATARLEAIANRLNELA